MQTVRGRTAAAGATDTNQLVSLPDFYARHIAPELAAPDVNDRAIIKADALKFLTTFRGQVRAGPGMDHKWILGLGLQGPGCYPAGHLRSQHCAQLHLSCRPVQSMGNRGGTSSWCGRRTINATAHARATESHVVSKAVLKSQG